MSCSGRPPCIAHSWCKVLSHRGQRGRLHTPVTPGIMAPCSILLLSSGLKLPLTTIRRFNFEIQLSQLSHSQRIDTFQHTPLLLLFGVIRPYFYKVRPLYVRVSAVRLRAFALRRSTDCRSCYLHHSVLFSTTHNKKNEGCLDWSRVT